MTVTRVGVRVCADDDITRVGLTSQLVHRHEVMLVDDDGPSRPLVTIVLSDEVHERAVQMVRSARQGGGGRVVLVVSRLDEGGLLQAVEAGVSSILRRSEASPDRIIEAVQAAASGAASMSPELLGQLLDHFGRLQRDVLAPRGITFCGLTDRELRVLRLIAEGHDTNEVGKRLYYSERTVKNIIHDITSRLNLRNRTHAVAYALRQGLI